MIDLSTGIPMARWPQFRGSLSLQGRSRLRRCADDLERNDSLAAGRGRCCRGATWCGLRLLTTGSAYANFMPEDEANGAAGLGAATMRLAALKAKYDPNCSG